MISRLPAEPLALCGRSLVGICVALLVAGCGSNESSDSARMNLPTESGYDAMIAFSADSGQSFDPPLRVSSRSSSPKEVATQAAGATWFPGWDDTAYLPGGDNIGLTVAPDETFLAVWPDARTGDGHDGVQQPYLARIRSR